MAKYPFSTIEPKWQKFWDENKIYNVGGYWYYEGQNNVEVKTTKYGDTSYDFWKIPYHDIDFDSLHEVSANENE